jgi:hypothetical protein
MLSRSSNLKDPNQPRLEQARRERLQQCLNQNAPDAITLAMAEHWLRSYKVSWSITLGRWKLLYFPHWLLWLTDRPYRRICSEHEDEFEEMMARELAPVIEMPAREEPEQQ